MFFPKNFSFPPPPTPTYFVFTAITSLFQSAGFDQSNIVSLFPLFIIITPFRVISLENETFRKPLDTIWLAFDGVYWRKQLPAIRKKEL